jgi:hypothetical protein
LQFTPDPAIEMVRAAILADKGRFVRRPIASGASGRQTALSERNSERVLLALFAMVRAIRKRS